jgi:N-acyl-D-aspartate/D-glutamate deacylase
MDFVIKNAFIVDGSGKPGYEGDVGIEKDRIVSVGGKLNAGQARVIDARGRVVSPGFIDLHTHYDAQLRWDSITPSSWHGVTTAIMGNCGYAVAPCKPADRVALAETLARVEGMPIESLEPERWNWVTFEEYLDSIQHRLGINVGSLIAHSAIRYYVMGEAAGTRAANPEELAQMKQVVEGAMRAGAFGFSSSQLRHHVGQGGNPVPSRLATAEELVALAGASARHGGMFEFVGPDNADADILEALRGFKGIADTIGGPATLAVLLHTWVAPTHWKLCMKELDALNARGGQPIHAWMSTHSFDFIITLTSSCLVLGDMPTWVELLSADMEGKRQRVAQPAFRQRLAVEANDTGKFMGGRFERIKVTQAALARNKHLEGRWVADLARERGISPVDMVIDLSMEEDCRTEFLMVGAINGDEDAVGAMLAHPALLVGFSDAGAHLDSHAHYGFATRALGHYVRGKRVMPLEEAVRKLTSLPAAAFNIKGRGLLAPGMKADITVFNPDTVDCGEPEWRADVPGGARRLVTPATGIDYVLVNGQVLVEHGGQTGAHPGRLLRLNAQD